MKYALSIALATIALLATFVFGIMAGAAPLPVTGILSELTQGFVDPLLGNPESFTDRQAAIFWSIRLPRVVLAALVGATLAIAGAAYQAVFRNPLADPYLLGVSSGAALSVTVGIMLGVSSATVPWIGFFGGILAVVATYLAGSSAGDRSGPLTVVLAGVAVAAFANAVQSYLLQKNSETLRRVYGWMLGQLGTATWSSVVAMVVPAVLGVGAILVAAKLLDVMTLGDMEASSLGVNPRLVRFALVVAATLATSAAVSVSGLIGFVGIIVPHTIRLIVGPGHVLLLPLTALWGATFLSVADIFARVALAPEEIPVGVVTAALGAPFFLFLLHRHGRSRS
ncbi:FecCD family ABC transporter permease [Corynebacterium sp. H78]|uniref:FecCD family ABC transporter permease n=1 Tax=Corynebacterium sp. H78 TaxID=3133417 RepID=UPI00309DE487